MKPTFLKSIPLFREVKSHTATSKNYNLIKQNKPFSNATYKTSDSSNTPQTQSSNIHFNKPTQTFSSKVQTMIKQYSTGIKQNEPAKLDILAKYTHLTQHNKTMENIEPSFAKILDTISDVVDSQLQQDVFKSNFEPMYLNHFGVKSVKDVEKKIAALLTDKKQNNPAETKEMSDFLNGKVNSIKVKTLLFNYMAEQLHAEPIPPEKINQITEGWVQSSLQRALLVTVDRQMLANQGELFASYKQNIVTKRTDLEMKEFNQAIDIEKGKLDPIFDAKIADVNAHSEHPIIGKNGQLIDSSAVDKIVDDTMLLLGSLFSTRNNALASTDTDTNIHTNTDITQSADDPATASGTKKLRFEAENTAPTQTSSPQQQSTVIKFNQHNDGSNESEA